MKKYLNITEAANLLNISKESLRRWDKEGILVPEKTSGKHRRYDYDVISNFYNKPQLDIIAYHNDNDLEYVKMFCLGKGYQYTLVSDYLDLLKRVLDKEVCKVVVMKDTLDDTFKLICKKLNVEIEIIEK